MSKGFVIWLTGLPASGKTTVAKLLARKLAQLGVRVQVLESDELRKVITPQAKYTEEERDHFYSVLVYIAKLLSDNGVNVIIDATGNKRKYRRKARDSIEKFMEVYLKCPLQVCMQRDPKGIYRMALEGKAKTVPGLQSKYEEPENPELTLNTAEDTPEQCTKAIIEKMKELALITG